MVLTHVEHTLRNKQYYKKVFRTYYQAYKKYYMKHLAGKRVKACVEN